MTCCLRVQSLDLLHAEFQLLGLCLLCPAEHYRCGVLNLIVEKLAESLHLLGSFQGVYHCNQSVQLHIVILLQINHGGHDIGKFADAGGSIRIRSG